MARPTVTITTRDGQLGVLPISSGKPTLYIGPSTAGSLTTPSVHARARLLQAAYGYGPNVEYACADIATYGRPAGILRCAATTAGTVGDINDTGVAGTSDPTVDAVLRVPNDTYDIAVRIVTGGTVETAGIAYQYSLNYNAALSESDNNWSPPIALGTATAIDIPDTGIQFDLAAGTLLAGDIWTLRCNGPECGTSDVQAAAEVIAAWATEWEHLVFTAPVSTAIAGVLDGLMTTMRARGQFTCFWSASARVPTAVETDATYQTALGTELAALATTFGNVVGGTVQHQSAVPGRANFYRRPALIAIAAKLGKVSEEVDIAQIVSPGGPLGRVVLADQNGNLLHHDETIQSGLDDLRLTSLCSQPGRTGIYVTNPRIRSAAGSDFEFVQHRRVMNLFEAILYAYFSLRLSKDVFVSKKTGFILESEAIEMERGAEALLRKVMKTKASEVSVSLARDDALLSTKTLSVDAGCVPKGYVKQINISTGFVNPALTVKAA